MFETIKRLYEKTRNKAVAANAVKKGKSGKPGWITPEQYKQITGEEYIG